jgi:plastocyanin
MKRMLWLVAVLLAGLLVLAGCGGQGGSSSSTTAGTGGTTGTSGVSIPAGAVQVIMQNTAFVPAQVTVKVGQTVAWVNQDSTQHDVVASDGSFRSQLLDTGRVFTFTFSKAGSFAYYCAIHPQMTGTVTVQP